ncbi:MAG: cytochrome c oxidase subunit 3 [Hyphomicrobiales bacterium]|nr:cytochrome c oxidase subunit 3 [Hyphomicrobiales bacterium]
MSAAKGHDFHIVNPSPWPIVAAFSTLTAMFGAVLFFHEKANGQIVLIAAAAMLLLTAGLWWRDVIREGRFDHAHTGVVRRGLRAGMALFILSEVMFFAAFFWSFFKAWLAPVAQLDGYWPVAEGVWPPEGIEPFDPWHIPFLNTLILLLSGTTVTWAHHALLEGNQKDLVRGLGITVLLGILFTSLQAYEYSHATFSFTQGIYPSNFYMATGFHGFHVIVGTVFLAVCFFRAKAGQFSEKHHLGFEFAAWYWHFVDVVWIFLFFWVYWVSSL